MQTTSNVCNALENARANLSDRSLADWLMFSLDQSAFA
jgi:hypothetical protein